ncbi:hypothetical protein ACV34H_33960, partial [Pseudomonas aeruginosa]
MKGLALREGAAGTMKAAGQQRFDAAESPWKAQTKRTYESVEVGATRAGPSFDREAQALAR